MVLKLARVVGLLEIFSESLMFLCFVMGCCFWIKCLRSGFRWILFFWMIILLFCRVVQCVRFLIVFFMWSVVWCIFWLSVFVLLQFLVLMVCKICWVVLLIKNRLFLILCLMMDIILFFFLFNCLSFVFCFRMVCWF